MRSVVLLPFACLLYVVAHPLAKWIADLLPAAATVGSAGTSFPGFHDAFGFELRALAYLLGRTPWLGLTVSLVVMGRPQLVFVWMAVVVAEVLVPPEGMSRSLRVDGLVISRFGGAYLFHVLWIFPV